MLQSAQHLEQAEKALRKIIGDLIVVAPSSPAIYETILELAAVGKAIQERIRVELLDAEGENALFIAAGI